MLRVFEIFPSIQGESTYQGFSCTFVRLSGCNLRCTWCDTPETWNDPGTPMEVNEVLSRIRSMKNELVEITGGEPLLQEDAFTLMDRLVKEGYTVLVETSGSVPIAEVNPRAVVVLDVKPPSSGEEQSNDFNNLQLLLPGDEIKFPIAGEKDWEFALDVMRKRMEGFDFTLRNAYVLRPEEGTRPALRAAWKGPVPVNVLVSPVEPYMDPGLLARWIMESGIEGLRLQIQLHKAIDMP